MFFTDARFFLIALPLLVIAFNLVVKRSLLAGITLLLTASIALYFLESPRYLPLLAACILLNFAVGTAIERARGIRYARLAFALGIAFDLGLLAYYKYAGASFGGTPTASGKVPMGVSFYAITLIVYLCQVYKSRNSGKLFDLALIASYFPHLAAGPILYYKDVASQIASARQQTIEATLRGATLFLIGLVKKVFIADAIAQYADFAFNYAAAQGSISMLYAWAGAFAFLLQLYFDFSGYSDMAVGISMLFGIMLPMNFNSPLKARNFAEFWRRWHMSLSRVLREFVFVPLGGLSRSAPRRYMALVLTMVIGGAWHGATLNYWLFGLYCGVVLCVCHWYHARTARNATSTPWPRAVGVFATWATLAISVVFFRADTLQTAWAMFKGMAGFTGFASAQPMQAGSLKFSQFAPEPVMLGLHGLAMWKFAILAASTCTIVLGFRNSNEIVGIGKHAGIWRASFRWGVFAGILAALAFGSLGSTSRFLYVNF